MKEKCHNPKGILKRDEAACIIYNTRITSKDLNKVLNELKKHKLITMLDKRNIKINNIEKPDWF